MDKEQFERKLTFDLQNFFQNVTIFISRNYHHTLSVPIIAGNMGLN
ncbi:unnamed protein product, partial [Allacma fusca]